MNIDKIYKTLNSGGLVISPTDTIYGIMGDALNENVIKKIYKVKKRDYSKPLILLMDSYDMIKKYIAGADVVYGVRSSRKKDTFFKKFTAEGFYKLMNISIKQYLKIKIIILTQIVNYFNK